MAGLQKAKVYNIAESNIALFGSEFEKKVKLEAAQHEEAWKVAGKEPGVQIWRIEQFKVVPVPPEFYGTFYSGDSYIVLRTYKGVKDTLQFDVHFWLGTYTTQDEAGTAAYKTVELDDYLGGVPVQYREVQGYESARFIHTIEEYTEKHHGKGAKHGIRILEGGKETGFKHVEGAKHVKRLLHIKGTLKNVRVTEVAFGYSSLNSGDVFILDAGNKVIQWNGSKSGPGERAKASVLREAITNEREKGTVDEVVEEGKEGKEFWELLGGEGKVHSAAEGGSDAEVNKKAEPVLFQLSDASGKFVLTEVGKGQVIPRHLLKSEDVFILFTGSEVYAWVGKGSSQGEKKKALSFAQEYIVKTGLPPHTPVIRILEGGENEVFDSIVKAH